MLMSVSDGRVRALDVVSLEAQVQSAAENASDSETSSDAGSSSFDSADEDCFLPSHLAHPVTEGSEYYE